MTRFRTWQQRVIVPDSAALHPDYELQTSPGRINSLAMTNHSPQNAGFGRFIYILVRPHYFCLPRKHHAMLELQPFVDAHKPTADVQRADAKVLRLYKRLLPTSLLQIWKEIGFGRYSDGLIQIINPEEFKQVLYGWLMLEEEDPTRIPIAISAFGHLFYYRRLTDDGDEDVSCINPHTSEASVLTWSLTAFFNEFLCSPQAADEVLERSAYLAAVEKHGSLSARQVFAYSPALRLGGCKDTSNVVIVDANVHLDILLQLALGN